MSNQSSKLDIATKLNPKNLLSKKEIKNLDPQEISQLIGFVKSAVFKKTEREGDLEGKIEVLRKSSDKRILLFMALSSIPALTLYVVNYLADLPLPEGLKDIDSLEISWKYLINPENKDFFNNTSLGFEFINVLYAFIGVGEERIKTKYLEALQHLEDNHKGNTGLDDISELAEPVDLGTFGKAIHPKIKIQIIKLLKDFMKLRKITNKDIMKVAGIEI